MKKDFDDILAGIRGSASASTPSKAKQYLETIQKEKEALIRSNEEQIEALKLHTLDADLDRINKEIERDFGLVSEDSLPVNELERFQSIAAELKNALIGQDTFIDALILAFKRPLVMGEGKVKNNIIIGSLKGSGRHTALKLMAQGMKKQRLLHVDEVAFIDLSKYPTSNEEKLFLQDLYTALKKEGSIIAFEHLEQAYPGYLKLLASLASSGSALLNKRYAIQKDSLVEAGNALVKSAVSSFSAEDKYLVFITEQKPESLGSILGREFMASVNDICVTKALESADIEQITAQLCLALKHKAMKYLHFDLIFEESFMQAAATHYRIALGVPSLQQLLNDVYKALSQFALLNPEKMGTVTLKAEPDLKAVIGDDVIELVKAMENDEELRSVKEELSGIVGLDNVKEYIYAIEDHVNVQRLRSSKGLKTSPLSMHMIFTGNPGTGKTTIARICARYLKAIGVLNGGQLVEVTRADLVGKYVGHTAPLTREIIQSALGGVLFIDEAYALVRGKDDSFGNEAIDTLVKEMEDHRDNLVVILAGYTKEMNAFLQANSGLKSRFPNILEFSDYTGEELVQIACSIAKGKGYVIDDEACELLAKRYAAVQLEKGRDGGNGRLARNSVEAAILKQSKRVLKDADAQLELLMSCDFDD